MAKRPGIQFKILEKKVSLNISSIEKVLNFACQENLLEIVKDIMKNKNMDVNQKIEDSQSRQKMSSFHLACHLGHLEIVKVMMENEDVDLNVESNYGQTPLYSVCAKGRVDIVDLLLRSQRVDVNIPEQDGITPFWISCYHGRLEVVKILMNNEIIDINKEDKDGRTPFYAACIADGNGWEVAKLLLSNERVDIHRTKKDGTSPFKNAITLGRSQVVKVLLESDIPVGMNPGLLHLQKKKARKKSLQSWKDIFNFILIISNP